MADSDDVVMAPADARAGGGGAAGAGGGRRAAAAAAYPRRRGAADRAAPTAAVAPRQRRARSPADKQPKRRLGANITNDKDLSARHSKKTKNEPKEKVAFEWSAEDMASDVAPSDATIVSVACRQVYRITTAIQATHAPKIKRATAFSSHAGSDAAEAVKARRSGAAPSAAAGALKVPPLWGGISHAKNAPSAPAGIVGVLARHAASSALGVAALARKKQTQKGQGKAGQTRAPQFRLWRGDREGLEGTPWYTDIMKATADCKLRWPVAKDHADYATTKMTSQMVSVMQGKTARKFPPGVGKAVKVTKWKLALKCEE